jgi:hypothetical protein
MPVEVIGEVGTPDASREWIHAECQLAIKHLIKVCGEPPPEMELEGNTDCLAGAESLRRRRCLEGCRHKLHRWKCEQSAIRRACKRPQAE